MSHHRKRHSCKIVVKNECPSSSSAQSTFQCRANLLIGTVPVAQTTLTFTRFSIGEALFSVPEIAVAGVFSVPQELRLECIGGQTVPEDFFPSNNVGISWVVNAENTQFLAGLTLGVAAGNVSLVGFIPVLATPQVVNPLFSGICQTYSPA